MSQGRGTAERMVEAAHALLDALSADQRRRAQWEFPSNEERRRWFYTPTDHGGLTLGEMQPAQQRRGMRLLATGLSRAGYVTAATIMGLEYDNTTRDANHVHTVWRDPVGDFGMDVLGAHRRQAHYSVPRRGQRGASE